MAETIENVTVNKTFNVQVDFNSSDATQKTVKALSDLNKKAEETTTKFKSAAQQFKEMIKDMTGFQKTAAYAGLALGTMEKAAGGIKTLAGNIATLTGATVGLQKSLNTILDYNKNIIALSAAFGKYNTSINEVEASFSRMSKTLSITKADSMSLLKLYEKGFPLGNLQSAEKLFANIKDVVGSNVDEIKNMANSLATLASKYPSLQKHIDRRSESDKAILASQIKLMLMSKEITLAQAKELMVYVDGGKKKSEADLLREKQSKDYLEVIGKMNNLWEQIAITIGTTLMPYMKALGYILESFGGIIVPISLGLLGWSASIIAAKNAMITLKAAATGLNFLGFGAGAAKGAAVGAAGAAASGAAAAGGGALAAASAWALNIAKIIAPPVLVIVAGAVALYQANQARKTADEIGDKIEEAKALDATSGSRKGGVARANIGGKAATNSGFFSGIVNSFTGGGWNYRVGGGALTPEHNRIKAMAAETDAAEMANLGINAKAAGATQLGGIAKSAGLITGSVSTTSLSSGDRLQTIEQRNALLDKNRELSGSILKNMASEAEMSFQLGNTEASLAKYAQVREQAESQINKEAELRANNILRLKEEIQQIEVEAAQNALDNARKISGFDMATADEQKKIIQTVYQTELSTNTHLLGNKQKLKEQESMLNEVKQEGIKVSMGLLEVAQKAYEFSKQMYGSQKSLTMAIIEEAGVLGKKYSDVVPFIEAANVQLKQQREDAKAVIKNADEVMSREEKGSANYKKAQMEKNAALADSAKVTKELQENEMAGLAVYEQRNKIAAQGTQYAEALVQLQNNYVIGAKASVENQMKVADAIRSQIDLKDQQLADAEKELKEHPGLIAEEKVNQLRIERLGLLTKEAEAMRSLRDGWVGAVNAMSIGSGRIAKIKISADENQRMALQYMGQYRSAKSGATARGGESIGETGIEQFGFGAGGFGIQGGGRGQGYQTDYGLNTGGQKGLDAYNQRVRSQFVGTAGTAAAAVGGSRVIGTGMGRGSVGAGSDGAVTASGGIGSSAINDFTAAIMAATKAINEFNRRGVGGR